jgi:hypothetical protein
MTADKEMVLFSLFLEHDLFEASFEPKTLSNLSEISNRSSSLYLVRN